ncbi:MAG: shikimate dehydrogenase [Alphaproteobacteria bacterium]|nr:shikimate dehydrogenase [Alphaproteobacteria bacterium]
MTSKAFVAGHPVDHSRSPLIFRHWFERYSIDGDYQRADVPPEGLADFVAGLRAGAFVGGNVTVPHKQAVLGFCDAIDKAAAAIGAVNILAVEAGRINGSNSDWYGLLANFDDRAPGWDEKPGSAIVVGAGGAARGVVYGLALRGFSPIRILNRTAEKAAALAKALAPGIGAELQGFALTDFTALAREAGLVVNTSTIGMHGSRFADLPLASLPDTALVADIVYTPLRTPLLAEADARGLRTIDGLGMLLHQAVPAFETWFGFRPEVTPELRALVERDMGLT